MALAHIERILTEVRTENEDIRNQIETGTWPGGPQDNSTWKSLPPPDYRSLADALKEYLNHESDVVRKAAEAALLRDQGSRSETRASFQEVDIERNPLTHQVIAIDGPSASGKGTVARMLATELGYLHIDLGTFNRAIAEKALREGVDLDDSKAVQNLLERTTLEARFVNAQTQLLRDGLPVTDSIRSAETGNAAAVISRHAGVLQWIFQQARSIGENHDVVMEGRNIGTDVFPDAQWKFYITADVEVRAARRLSDFRRAGDVNISLRQVQEDLQDRDQRDRTRSVAPFRKAVDAFEIDNTSRSADETVEIMKSLMADSSARPETRTGHDDLRKEKDVWDSLRSEMKDTSGASVMELVRRLIVLDRPPVVGGIMIRADMEENEVLDLVYRKTPFKSVDDFRAVLRGALNGDADQLRIYDLFFRPSTDKFPMNVIFLCGGTGSNGISQALASKLSVPLELLLNAYDDGKSTGQIRRDFHMLGPSDIAKNIAALLDPEQAGAPDIKKFLELRLDKTVAPEELWGQLIRVIHRQPGQSVFEDMFHGLPTSLQDKFREYLASFARGAKESAKRKNVPVYDLRDYGVRNLIFTGAYIRNGRSYKKAIGELQRLLSVRANILLNNSRHLQLVAITESGALLPSEAAIVDHLLDQDIREIYLLEKSLTDTEKGEFESLVDIAARQDYLASKNSMLFLNNDARKSLAGADILMFAPTTLESSLTPTLATRGFGRAYLQSQALKIMVFNLTRERGKRTVSEYLLRVEELLKEQLGPQYFIHDLMDYVIVNTHGYRVDVQGGKMHIPVDQQNIRDLGVEAIEVDIEDGQHPGKHDGEMTAQLILALKRLDELGYRFEDGRLISKVKERKDLAKDRRVLERLLANPLLCGERRDRIIYLASRIMGFKDLESFVPSGKTRIIIAAAGRSTRLASPIPKPLFPINGKPSLSYLVERIRELDPNFIVATNKDNDKPIREMLEKLGISPHTVIASPHKTGWQGTGVAVLAAEDQLRNDRAIDNVLVIWSDATNIQLLTLKTALLLHEALPEFAVTIPTSWEANPYAGVERDSYGKVTGLFQTKGNPSMKRSFGEHDASFFIITKALALKGLHELGDEIQRSGVFREVDLLEAISRLVKQGEKAIAFSGVDPRETIGFNTVQEAKIVEKNERDLRIGLIPTVSYQQQLNEKDNEFESLIAQRSAPLTPDQERQFHARYLQAIERTYNGILFDVDENLTDENGQIPEDVIMKLVELARRRIPVGFVTGRREESLKRMLLSKISHVSGNDPEVLSFFYVYHSEGAVGYQLSNPENKFYERKIPHYLSEAAMKLIREKLLRSDDLYHVTDYKITIWPHLKPDQPKLMLRINELMRLSQIPMRARLSSSITTNAAMIVSSTEDRSLANKGVALEDFSKRTGLLLDQIAKVGDRGDKDAVDHEMLVGGGSFSSNAFDVESPYQIPLSIVLGRRNLDAVRFLLEGLKLESKELTDYQIQEGVRSEMRWGETVVTGSVEILEDFLLDRLVGEMTGSRFSGEEVRKIMKEHLRRLKQRERIDLAEEKWKARLKLAVLWLLTERRERAYDHMISNVFGVGEQRKIEIDKAADSFAKLMRAIHGKEGKTFFIYSGGSGVGKSAIWESLMNRYPEEFTKFVIYTTREKREGETDGVQYHFVSETELQEKEKKGETKNFVMRERPDVKGLLQGVSLADLKRAADGTYAEGKIVVLEATPQMTAWIRQRYGDKLAAFFVSPFPEQARSEVRFAPDVIRAASEMFEHVAVSDRREDIPANPVVVVLGNPVEEYPAYVARALDQLNPSKILVVGNGVKPAERYSIVKNPRRTKPEWLRISRALREKYPALVGGKLHIDRHDNSMNTAQNIEAVVSILARDGISPESVVLVQAPQGLLVSKRIFEKQWNDKVAKLKAEGKISASVSVPQPEILTWASSEYMAGIRKFIESGNSADVEPAVMHFQKDEADLMEGFLKDIRGQAARLLTWHEGGEGFIKYHPEDIPEEVLKNGNVLSAHLGLPAIEPKPIVTESRSEMRWGETVVTPRVSVKAESGSLGAKIETAFRVAGKTVSPLLSSTPVYASEIAPNLFAGTEHYQSAPEIPDSFTVQWPVLGRIVSGAAATASAERLVIDQRHGIPDKESVLPLVAFARYNPKTTVVLALIAAEDQVLEFQKAVAALQKGKAWPQNLKVRAFADENAFILEFNEFYNASAPLGRPVALVTDQDGSMVTGKIGFRRSLLSVVGDRDSLKQTASVLLAADKLLDESVWSLGYHFVSVDKLGRLEMLMTELTNFIRSEARMATSA